MIVAYAQKGKRISLSEIKDAKFYLIECIDPSEEEMEEIIKKFDLYEMDVIDSLDLTEIPRVVKRRKYIHVILSTILRVEDYFEKRSFGIFLMKNGIIIFEKEKIPIKIRKMYSVADAFIDILAWNLDIFKNALKILRDDYDVLESEIYKAGGSMELAMDIWDLRDDITTISRVLKENEVVYENFFKGKFLKGKEILFGDLLYDLRQYKEIAETLERDVKSAFDAYMSVTSYDMGKKVERLTYITIALAIPEIIASLYGMNVSLPLQSHPLAFFIILSFSMLLAILIYLLLRK